MNAAIARTTLLLMVLLAASAGLASLWFDKQGQVRNIHWVKPEPVTATVPKVSFTEPVGVGLGAEQFADIVEHPLFAADRLPPPPPQIVEADVLDDARLLGLMEGEKGGVLIRAEGRIKLLNLDQKIGKWTLASVEPRAARFDHGGEKRILKLEYTPLGSVPKGAAVAPGGPAGPSVSRIGNFIIPENLPPADRAEVEARVRHRLEVEERLRNRK